MNPMLKRQAEQMEIGPEMLARVLGRYRKPDIVVVRDELIWRLRHLEPAEPSYPTIGEMLGKSHSTIIAACSRHEERMRQSLAEPMARCGSCGRRSHRVRVTSLVFRCFNCGRYWHGLTGLLLDNN